MRRTYGSCKHKVAQQTSGKTPVVTESTKLKEMQEAKQQGNAHRHNESEGLEASGDGLNRCSKIRFGAKPPGLNRFALKFQ